MARRAPLIAPGSVLATREENPGESVMDDVIARHKQRKGIEESPATESIEDNITSNITPNTTNNITARKSANARMREEIREPSNMPAREEIIAEEQMPAQDEGVGALAQAAEKLGKSRMVPMTLRIPEKLDDYLTEQAHRLRKRGVKKQDLVSRAVQLLYVAIESGEIELGQAEDDED